MKKIQIGSVVTSLILLGTACSKAPVVEFPEPTDRFVLVEFFTEDY